MLRRTTAENGVMEAQIQMSGPGVFLDVWAIRDIAHPDAASLQDRFVRALRAKGGTLLVSTALVTELARVLGDARTAVENFFSAMGRHWLLLNPITGEVIMEESARPSEAALSRRALKAFVENRLSDLDEESRSPSDLSDDAFFDLRYVMVWTAGDSSAVKHIDDLKAAAKIRAEAEEREQRQDSSYHANRYPPVAPEDERLLLCAHNAVWREVVRRAPGRRWMPNDGFDVVHLIPALV